MVYPQTQVLFPSIDGNVSFMTLLFWTSNQTEESFCFYASLLSKSMWMSDAAMNLMFHYFVRQIFLCQTKTASWEKHTKVMLSVSLIVLKVTGWRLRIPVAFCTVVHTLAHPKKTLKLCTDPHETFRWPAPKVEKRTSKGSLIFSRWKMKTWECHDLQTKIQKEQKTHMQPRY